MQRRLVAANWKMNGDSAFARDYAAALGPELENLDSDVRVVILPPAVLLPVLEPIMTRRAALGAQNVAPWSSGAYTGEISAAMVADQQAHFTLVGHSERRQYFGEDDALIGEKVDQALAAGLQPILCVGETLEQRDGGQALAVVERQLSGALGHLNAEALGRVVVAYEPVWAIGTGRSASAEDAQEVHGHIRSSLARLGAPADEIPIIYGGSVKPDTAADLFAQPDIDGGLVGGASLKASDFAAICRSA